MKKASWHKVVEQDLERLDQIKDLLDEEVKGDAKKMVLWFDMEFNRCDDFDKECFQCKANLLRDGVEEFFNALDGV